MSDAAPAPELLFEVADGIATITLNRPEARNALSEGMRLELDKALAEIKARAGDDIKAVILTGAGKAFCSGGDVKGMGQRGAAGPVGSRARMRSAHNRLYELAYLEVPVIAAVNGFAAGAGFSFALQADFLIATPSTRFANSFVRIGLIPDWSGLWLLPRVVGLQKAKELVFTGRQFGAEEAKRLGIVHAIVPEGRLMDAARDFAGRFRDASTSAIGIAKNALLNSFHLDHRTMLELEAMSQGISYSSDYHKEAARRFAAKEPSMFDWEAIEKKAAE